MYDKISDIYNKHIAQLYFILYRERAVYVYVD